MKLKCQFVTHQYQLLATIQVQVIIPQDSCVRIYFKAHKQKRKEKKRVHQTDPPKNKSYKNVTYIFNKHPLSFSGKKIFQLKPIAKGKNNMFFFLKSVYFGIFCHFGL